MHDIMTYTKEKLGLELKAQLIQGKDYNAIASWAFKIYLEHGLDFEQGLDYFVLKLMAMEEGPEFILSKQDLLNLSNILINQSH